MRGGHLWSSTALRINTITLGESYAKATDRDDGLCVYTLSSWPSVMGGREGSSAFGSLPRIKALVYQPRCRYCCSEKCSVISRNACTRGQNESSGLACIMATLTAIINDDSEPTIIKLKAMEMTMKAYNMLAQRREATPVTVSLNVDLSSSN